MGRRWWLGAGVCLALAGCRGSNATEAQSSSRGSAALLRHALPGEDLRGMSGLSRVPGARDRFLSVAERLHHVIPVQLGPDDRLVTGSPIRVVGVDRALDLEGLAFLDAGSLVFATEADRPRTHEFLLFADMEDDRIEVTDRVPFSYAPWGIVPSRNRGLEGVCAAGGRVVGVSEMVEGDGPNRWSPLGIYHPETGRWRNFRVALTSDTGKLSGLSCASMPGGIRVTAIERHFDLLHVVRFTIPRRGGENEVERLKPRVLADLRPRFQETPPNFEGLEAAGPGRFLLITDNDWRGVRGPTEMIFFEEPGSVLARPGAPSLGATLPP